MTERCKRRRGGLALAWLLAPILAITHTTPAPALPIASSPDAELRLATIGYRLSVASARLCAHPRALAGLLVHDLSQYDAGDRAGIARSFDLHDGIGVRDLVPEGAGARAGLERGDEITAIDGKALRGLLPPIGGSTGSYRRIEAFDQVLQGSPAAAGLALTVRRGGSERQVMLVPDRGCGGEAVLTPSSALNAWSDGRYVAVTTRLADFVANDDELAFVVAHETAHIILDQGGARLGLFDGAGTRGGAKARESDADRIGVRLMAGAGYDPAGAGTFLQRSARLRWLDLPISHPGIGARLRTVTSAAREGSVPPQ